jgi:RNA polymerase sigma factor (sigma-70 family)
MEGAILGDESGVTVANIDDRVEALFRREYEPMHRLAFTLLRCDAEAEEVVQDAFISVMGRLDTIANPGGYLRTTVLNGARKHLARRRVHDRLDERVGTPNAAWSSGPEYLTDLVDELPERNRIAVVLRYYAGWNATEIGEALDCPAGTVRSILHRSLDHLRGRLSDG